MSRGKTISPITSNLSSPTKRHEKVITYSGQPAEGDWSWAQSEREEAAGATALLRRSHASCSWVFPSYPTISKQTSQMLSTELRSVSSAATQVASNYCVCVCVSDVCAIYLNLLSIFYHICASICKKSTGWLTRSIRTKHIQANGIRVQKGEPNLIELMRRIHTPIRRVDWFAYCISYLPFSRTFSCQLGIYVNVCHNGSIDSIKRFLQLVSFFSFSIGLNTIFWVAVLCFLQWKCPILARHSAISVILLMWHDI